MTPQLENFINVLARRNLSYDEFVFKASEFDELAYSIDVYDIDMWRMLGLDIKHNNNDEIELNTRKRNIDGQIFCIVDIETSGGINSGQIIEIGALKLLDGRVIDSFETLVHAPFVPENISALTGITSGDLQDAPSLAAALEKFRLFLGDSVFVAHNVKFDYGFISASFANLGFGVMINRRICTIDLARRTIASPKYGLGTLKEILGIDNTHHRAMNDAVAAAEIFKACLKNVPSSVRYVEELIEFSKTANTMKKSAQAQLQLDIEE